MMSLGKRALFDLAPGLVALAAAVPLAFALMLIHDAAPDLRKGIAMSAVFLGACFGALLLGHIIFVRWRAQAWRVGFVALVGMVIGLTGAYATDISLVSMYLLLIAVVTFRARGLWGKKSVLEV